VERLSTRAEALQLSVRSINSRVQRLQGSVQTDFLVLQKAISKINRVHVAVNILRRSQKFLTALRKLRISFGDNEK